MHFAQFCGAHFVKFAVLTVVRTMPYDVGTTKEQQAQA